MLLTGSCLHHWVACRVSEAWNHHPVSWSSQHSACLPASPAAHAVAQSSVPDSLNSMNPGRSTLQESLQWPRFYWITSSCLSWWCTHPLDGKSTRSSGGCGCGPGWYNAAMRLHVVRGHLKMGVMHAVKVPRHARSADALLHESIIHRSCRLWKAIETLNLKNPIVSKGYNFYIAILYIVASVLLLSLGLCVWVGWCFKNQRFPFVW